MEPGRRRPLSGPPWAWRLVLGVVMGFLRHVLGWRVRVRARDVELRPDTPLVVVANHTSNVDVFPVAEVLWRRYGHWLQPLAKAEVFDLPVIGLLARHAGVIPVERGAETGREAAYAAAVARLREGGTILVMPEGTTTHDGSLLPLRHGAARLAMQAGVDLLVVTHFGAQRGFSPVVRFAERDVLVTMAMDVVSPERDEDAASLTGRIAATMLDRSTELRDAYPQADPDAAWWPPYSRPASPTATAHENLERYRHSMAEAIDRARARMATAAEERELDHRIDQARERAAAATEAVERARERLARFADEHDVEQRVADARERAVAAAEDLAARSRARAGDLAEQARQRLDLATRARDRRDPGADDDPSQPTGRRPWT